VSYLKSDAEEGRIFSVPDDLPKLATEGRADHAPAAISDSDFRECFIFDSFALGNSEHVAAPLVSLFQRGPKCIRNSASPSVAAYTNLNMKPSFIVYEQLYVCV
jgi:hypothetical protein